MNTLTEKQISYCAASIDGDGHLNIKEMISNTCNNGYSHNCEIEITSTNINFLNYINKITSIGLISIKSELTEKRKRSYRWYLAVNEMKLFINIIKNDLLIKQPQANILLEFLETYKIKYGFGKSMPNDVFILRSVLKDEIQEYNKLGPNNIYYDKNPKIYKIWCLNNPYKLSEKDKSYIAGAVDTEGTIDINRNFNKKGFNYHPVIKISNTNTNFLNYICKQTNIGQIILHNKETKRRKQEWQWQLNINEMKNFLEIIGNELIIKKRQMELMLEYFELTKIKYNKWNPRSNSVDINLEIIWEEMRELNAKGNKFAILGA
jgi:hypothetical protein